MESLGAVVGSTTRNLEGITKTVADLLDKHLNSASMAELVLLTCGRCPMFSLPERIGSYRISPDPREGGFGVVYEGHDDTLDRRVAVKVLREDKATDKDTVARFVREAKALRSLQGHRGIVSVYDTGEMPDGRPYLVMEFLAGKTLRAWMDQQTGAISLRQTLVLAEEIAATMINVHALSLVHRDLKPENIMLVDDPAFAMGLRPVLLDFGIAKLSANASADSQALTQIKTAGLDVIGTPAYMAPEQLSDADHVDNKADVYALGLVVYELLAGTLPFASNETMARANLRERGELVHLHDAAAHVPPLVASFVMAMLARAPNERPSMRETRRMFAQDWTARENECPFPGWRPLDGLRPHLCFGRHKETAAVMENLRSIHEGTSHRWLFTQGPTGAGKTSVLQAAVLPILDEHPEWFVVTISLAKDPIGRLASGLARAYGQNEKDLLRAFKKNAEALDTFLMEHHRSATKVLLVMDAFETLVHAQEKAVHQFVGLIERALKNIDSPLRLLTMVPSEYVPQLHFYFPELGELQKTYALQNELPWMDEAALLAVVEGMAHRAGLRLEKGLAQKIAQDVAGHAYRLPLIGQTLRYLWMKRNGEGVTRDVYDTMGGVGGAWAEEAMALLTNMPADGQERAKWMILDLVQLGSGAPDTRRKRTRADILRAAGDDAFAFAAWNGLSGDGGRKKAAERFCLVVGTGDASDFQRPVELVHESVLRHVPLIAEWIRVERPFLELLASLERAALEWHRAGVDKPADGLPTGSLLEHYRGGKDETKRDRLWRMATPEARAFLEAAQRLDVRQKRAKWAIMAAAMVAMVVIGVIAVIAVRARERAEGNLDALLQTTDKIVNDVDWGLGRLGHTLSIRRKLVDPLYKQLIELETSDSERVRVLLIDTEQRLSDLERDHGTIANARLHVEYAEDRIAAGLSSSPKNADFEALRALSFSKDGKLKLHEGNAIGALDDFRRAIEGFQKTSGKSDYSDDQTLATSYVEAGDAYAALGQNEASIRSYSQGLKMRQELMHVAPSSEAPYKQALVAEALMQRVNVMRDSTLVWKDLTDARELIEPLARNEQHNLFYQSIRGRTSLGFAQRYVVEGDWSHARKEYSLARDVGALLHGNAPEQKDYALLLIEALDGLQRAERKMGEEQAAEAPRKECVEMRNKFVQRDSRDRRVDRFTCQER